MFKFFRAGKQTVECFGRGLEHLYAIANYDYGIIMVITACRYQHLFQPSTHSSRVKQSNTCSQSSIDFSRPVLPLALAPTRPTIYSFMIIIAAFAQCHPVISRYRSRMHQLPAERSILDSPSPDVL